MARVHFQRIQLQGRLREAVPSRAADSRRYDALLILLCFFFFVLDIS